MKSNKFFWAGIDEAGYGPLLGPLVVAGTCFKTETIPSEGMLWDLLSDSLNNSTRNLDGRLVIADSKIVYSGKKGMKNLEEGVLSFNSCHRKTIEDVGSFFSTVCPHKAPEISSPWFKGTEQIKLPTASNRAAIESKSAMLGASLKGSNTVFEGACVCPVLPAEYNRLVGQTGNKSMLLWQKCGTLLQQFWLRCRGLDGFVLVDRHGGRQHYRRLLTDAFPALRCDVREENNAGSVYRISDGTRSMWVAFKREADSLALPVSLASMYAKYVRELYMKAFNSFWCGRIEELRPTAGYAADAKRFLRDIKPFIKKEALDTKGLVRHR